MNHLPEQTPEERARRIEAAKKREALEDQWVKDEGLTLERDSCEKCKEIWARDERNYSGSRTYCSSGHAYEVGNIKSQRVQEQRKKDLFKMVYDWGRNNVVVDDTAPAYRELVNTIEETYY